MLNTAIIRMPNDESAEAEWQITYGDGRIANGRSGLSELGERLQGLKVTVLVPACDVLLTEARVPTTNRQRMRRAIPFILEEQLTEDVEELHFALGTIQGDGMVPVAVVKKSLMDDWLHRLEAADIRPHLLLPETLALPWESGRCTLFIDEDRYLIRGKCAAGYEIPAETPDSLIAQTLNRDETDALLIIDARRQGEDDGKFADIGIEPQRIRQSSMEALVQGLSQAKPVVNLLQGGYSRQEQLGRQLRPWIPAAAMLLVWLLVQAGMMLHERFTLVEQEQLLAEQIEQLYRKTFPEARKVVNARVQMERHLEAMKGGQSEQGFISLMATTAPVLGKTKGLEVRALRYKQDGLTVDMQLDALQTLDKIKAGLAELGLQVDIESASSRDGKVESRMLVRGGAA